MLSDIALIHNNAKVGSQIACALSKQLNERKTKDQNHPEKRSADSESDIVSMNAHDGSNVSVIHTGPTMLFFHRLS